MASGLRVLVTGGAGFIGSCLIRTWLNRDPSVQIVNLDKLTYCGDLSRLSALGKNPRYSFIKGDVCDTRRLEKAMRGCHGVIHLAAETHVDRSLLEAKQFFDTNLYGTYALLEAARRNRVRRFLFVSTDEVYGSREKGFFTENDPLNPTSPYSISKAAADLLTLSYAKNHGINATVTRGSNTFGPYQYPEKVIPLFVSNALSNEPLPLYGDGLQVRNWIHVEDHARAIIHCFERGRSGESYNISGSRYLTNIELTRRILKILGKSESLIRKVKDRLGHDRRYALDSRKIRALGWKERFPFEDSIESTVLWYKQNESWWKKIKEKKDGDFRKYYAKAYTGRK
jgi:dTDP-glucose 4,6-dehydratase